jgi:hypothetical protein
MELTAPVLYITFARPEYARQSFDAIKKAKPKKLYFYSNKARDEKPDEVRRNEEVRKFVEEIDWECDLHTWFRDEYVDVWTSIPGAINWIYEKEDRAIVIEEDAVCSLAFFDFCQKMLQKYEKDQRIWSIGGSNNTKRRVKHQYDYYFSHYSFITGWASWRDRWERMDFKNVRARDILEADVMKATFCTAKEQRLFTKFLKQGMKGYETNRNWDGIFNFTCRAEGALTIIPAYHLVQDVGRGGVNSKTFLRSQAYKEINYDCDDYIINTPPPFMVPDYDFEQELYKYQSWQTSILRRGLDRICWLLFVKLLKMKPLQ